MKTINQLKQFDKPREKLVKKGVESLQDYELIAILLGSGVKGKDIIKLSKEIAKVIKDDFSKITLEKLLKIHGLGTAKASQIISAIELSKRHLLKESKTIQSSFDVYNEVKEYARKKQEYFLALYLDGANKLIANEIITIGILNESLVHPREVFAPAIEHRCASIIVAHNHPNGILKPSIEDIEVTKRLKDSSELLGIELLDHIIFIKEDYISLKELRFI